MRGIRNLDIAFDQKTFSISGPNGSGKSGVIDAIEFGLTGRISRLTGTGTKSLSIAEHGPHVDRVRFPDAAFVRLKVYFPALNKSAMITRKVSAPKRPKIEPADPDIKAAFEQLADHPEIALSRRDIVRFILVEPSRRAEEVQAILKLEEIGERRAVLNGAQNRVNAFKRTAEAQFQAARSSLLSLMQIPSVKIDDLLSAANARRKLLGLSPLAQLTPDTRLDAGLTSGSSAPAFNKQSALRDIDAIAETRKQLPELAKDAVAVLLATISTLADDPALLASLRRRTLLEQGIGLIDGAHCPLCDSPWESERHLRDHLAIQLEKSGEAQRLQKDLFASANVVDEAVSGWLAQLAAIRRLAQALEHEAFGAAIDQWTAELARLQGKFRSFDELRSIRGRLASGWHAAPKGFEEAAASFAKLVAELPDQTATVDAQTFLSTAQLRLTDFRESMRADKAAGIAVAAATCAYTTYCEVMDAELEALYDDVQQDFSTFYRLINEDDEGEFTAKLSPSAGKLDFDVNFYERGLYPPGAFHSEGHQDSMGVCLYLALMNRLFGNQFSFALLDDVVMSVDTGHRYQFCKLLKTHFKDTQFVITTHDRTWAEQMKSAGLVSGKTSLRFHSWTIDTGPLVESNVEVWEEIKTALDKNKVAVAAAALRRHLEYVSRHLADQLGAPVVFRGDGGYELNDLLPPVLARFKTICAKAADAAQSWGNDKGKAEATALKTKLSASNAASSVEQWAINKAVHYNEWENFGKRDFAPAADAFRELLECFRCERCESWLFVSPRHKPVSLRCACDTVSLNLEAKPR
ncbi:AAA family ATPase [Bradyrhizobium sp. WSM1253]|uniref:AAA family ATPase n=1 Tax=Bradyrhizobium sp. WSM1253 TaxID=319003 RepID=UPI001FD8773D|nr:AAA family ATPase [Bradyrhizobium sp. WSM1253]